jgi:hypothetical protein
LFNAPFFLLFQNVFKLADLQNAKLELLSKTFMADLEKELYEEMNPGKQIPQGALQRGPGRWLRASLPSRPSSSNPYHALLSPLIF